MKLLNSNKNNHSIMRKFKDETEKCIFIHS